MEEMEQCIPGFLKMPNTGAAPFLLPDLCSYIPQLYVPRPPYIMHQTCHPWVTPRETHFNSSATLEQNQQAPPLPSMTQQHD